MPYGNSARTKSIWAIATAKAKKGGAHDFSSGSPGDTKRKRIAEAIHRGKSPRRTKRHFGFGG